MHMYHQRALIVQCRFCGRKEMSHIEEVVDHFVENGCSHCQKSVNDTARRLLRQLDHLDHPGSTSTQCSR